MLKRFFIPLLLVLVMVAALLYWLLHSGHSPRDVRQAVPVERFTLRNGLQVVVMPNHQLPAVTHMLFVRAGGGDDPYGKSGLAHYLEHLMFGGTKNYPAGTQDRVISRIGGEQNAYTTRDYTVYHATVPRDALKQVMAMEADRLLNLDITDALAARELQVITEERNSRVENKPDALLSEQIDAMTFLNHPYGQPLIGWAEDMASFTAGDARAFFKRYYRAANMVVLVAGDVETGDVRRMAQEYYGALPAGAAPPRVWPKEPPLRLTRRGSMRDAKVREPRLLRQYVAPSLGDDGDSAAHTTPLSLMVQYLGGGSTSLLYQRLVVERKLATSVAMDYTPVTLGPSLVELWAVPQAGVTLEALEAALDDTIEEALGSLPPEEAVARAKTQLKAGVVFAQDGLEPLAHFIGGLMMIGKDERYFYDWSDAIDAIRATQMLEVAQQVMNPDRRVTGLLLPESDKPASLPVPATAASDTSSPVASEQVQR